MGGVVINEIEAAPLSEYVIDFITSQKKESPFLDFKLILHVDKNSNFPELAKDLFAFANYGGGWILIGWMEYPKSQYVPVGLSDNYQVDQATLQEKFNSYLEEPIELQYLEFTKDFKSLFINAKDEVKEKVNSNSNRFAAIYVPPSHKILIPKKDGIYQKDGKDRVVFKKGATFYRRGTQNINPSSYELSIINKRLEKENYRISVLSGEPDEIEETLHSNLFEISQLPKFVYLGTKKDLDDVSIKVLLKQEGIFPEWYYKFKEWNNKIVTFENLEDAQNPYRKLVDGNSVIKESLEKWLVNEDKNRIIVELLNKELRHYAIKKGLHYFTKKDNLYYSTSMNERKEKWKARYGASTRTVAAKMYAAQIGTSIYWNAAFIGNFLKIGGKFYLRILPTFVITEDGTRPIFGPKIGTIITRLSYNMYNDSYLNTILFWVHQLGDGHDVKIENYLTISSKPVQLKSPVGILYDIPSTEFRFDIEKNETRVIEEEDAHEL
ncbi:MAG: ATP-binding protein [Nanoarchaeota archaeon]